MAYYYPMQDPLLLGEYAYNLAYNHDTLGIHSYFACEIIRSVNAFVKSEFPHQRLEP
jgi:hypothetical protein